MAALLKKELRAQLPFVLLFLFMTIVGYISIGFERPLTLMTTERLYGEGLIDLNFDFVIAAVVISLAISYGLLVREFDDRTIEFLDAMPVSRTQLFIAKFVAGWSALAFLSLLDIVFILAIRSISTTSLDRSYHFDWIVTSVFLQQVQFYCFFSIGLALSFLRRFGWLLLGMFAWVLMIAGRFNPALDPSSLVLCANAQFDGTRWLIPWGLTVAYVVVGFVAMLIAYGLFLGGGRAILRLLSGSHSRAKQVVLLGCSAAIVFVGLGMMTQYALTIPQSELDPDAVRVNFPGWSRTSRRTDHYDVVFPNNLAGRANKLLDEADEIYDTVADFFNYDTDTRVSVDMTAYSGHHLGTAYWNKLKMDLTAHTDLAGLRRTLGHETTHVVIESLSDNQLRQQFGSTRFFHEGVATYVERRFFSDEDLVSQRMVAAVLHDRDETAFERLADNETLRAEHDSLLVYSLGEVFAAAVVRRFGDDALGQIARTFEEKRHSEGLNGIALWRSVFQAAGFSLNETLDEYDKLLDEAKERHAETIDRLPRLRPVVEKTPTQLVITTDQSPPEGFDIVVRFRAAEDVQDDQYWIKKFNNGRATARRRSFTGRAAWYQVGYRRKGMMTIFEPWQRVRL